MPFTKFSSIFAPADLEIIQRVFNQLCQERCLALKDGEQRSLLAAEVIDAFESGFIEEANLWQSLSKRRMAKARSLFRGARLVLYDGIEDRCRLPRRSLPA